MTPDEALECYFEEGQQGECWPWVGPIGREGYGFACIFGKSVLAHRIVYAERVGALEQGLVIRHSCDNPRCVNPAHLEQGTQRQNVQDRNSRGRTARGEASGAAKLTEAQVREIRSTPRYYGMASALARKFGVAPPSISVLLSGRTWRHVA